MKAGTSEGPKSHERTTVRLGYGGREGDRRAPGVATAAATGAAGQVRAGGFPHRARRVAAESSGSRTRVPEGVQWGSTIVGARGLSPPGSTAGCGKPHVRWCGRAGGRNPVSPTRSGLVEAPGSYNPAVSRVSSTTLLVPRAPRHRVLAALPRDHSGSVRRRGRQSREGRMPGQSPGTGRSHQPLARNWLAADCRGA